MKLVFHSSAITMMHGPINIRFTRSRVRPENLRGPKLVEKFPSFYGTRRFITAFSSTRYLSLP